MQVKWAGGQVFDTGREGGPVARLDGDGKVAQSPPDALLSALASCVSVDVVAILEKRRTPVTALQVEMVGERVRLHPRAVSGTSRSISDHRRGVERVHAERAVELAVTKYCSVRDSLAPDIQVDWTIDLR